MIQEEWYTIQITDVDPFGANFASVFKWNYSLQEWSLVKENLPLNTKRLINLSISYQEILISGSPLKIQKKFFDESIISLGWTQFFKGPCEICNDLGFVKSFLFWVSCPVCYPKLSGSFTYEEIQKINPQKKK